MSIMLSTNDPIVRPEAKRTASALTGITLIPSRSSRLRGSLLLEDPKEQDTDQGSLDKSKETDFLNETELALPASIEALLGNSCNFQTDSELDILQVSRHKTGWHTHVTDAKFESILSVSPYSDRFISVLNVLICSQDAEKSCDISAPSLLLIVARLEKDPRATWRCRSSMSNAVFYYLARKLQFNQQILEDILGRPDYWSAVKSFDNNGRVEVGCQFARWRMSSRWDNSHGPVAPFSIAFQHDPQRNLTIYTISCDPVDSCMTTLNEWLGLSESSNPSRHSLVAHMQVAQSPFLIIARALQESFEQSKVYVAIVKDRLMSQISKVDDYNEARHKYTDDPRDIQRFWRDQGRNLLERITEELHQVSQTIDSGMANIDMSIKLTQKLKTAFDINNLPVGSPHNVRETGDLIEYLLDSWNCEMNWLKTYKARKDTTMNFVFNAVTQQDSAINIDIAHKMSRDSSSMNAITILTMIFLPGTFISGVFGSGILTSQAYSNYALSPLFWPFIAILSSFTIGVFALWLNRKRLEQTSEQLSQRVGNVPARIRRRLFGRKRPQEDSVALNNV